MSFGLPSVKPEPGMPERFDIASGIYGVPSVMHHGFAATKVTLGAAHPLELSEKIYAENKHRMNLMALRNIQGLHAPLKITMELKAAKQVGRLSFLPSSNIMSDVLTGRDEEIGFEDFLNTAEFREQMGQPHAMVERQLGIL